MHAWVTCQSKQYTDCVHCTIQNACCPWQAIMYAHKWWGRVVLQHSSINIGAVVNTQFQNVEIVIYHRRRRCAANRWTKVTCIWIKWQACRKQTTTIIKKYSFIPKGGDPTHRVEICRGKTGETSYAGVGREKGGLSQGGTGPQHFRAIISQRYHC